MKPNDKLVSDLQKMHEADLERIKKFRLLDDDFMSKVFEDSECAEILLKIMAQSQILWDLGFRS